MKKHVVSLAAFLFFLVVQTSHALAGHSVRVGFETIPTVVVHSGPQVFSLGNKRAVK